MFCFYVNSAIHTLSITIKVISKFSIIWQFKKKKLNITNANLLITKIVFVKMAPARQTCQCKGTLSKLNELWFSYLWQAKNVLKIWKVFFEPNLIIDYIFNFNLSLAGQATYIQGVPENCTHFLLLLFWFCIFIFDLWETNYLKTDHHSFEISIHTYQSLK